MSAILVSFPTPYSVFGILPGRVMSVSLRAPGTLLLGAPLPANTLA